MKQEKGHWVAVSAGPTTSSRMEEVEDILLDRFNIHWIIGKGGMGERTAKALKKTGSVYAAFPGGAGVLAAEKIKNVSGVYWLEELGMPEAVWVFEVKEFGPLVVAMDSTGDSLSHL
jgi:tartrate/fumarate subfamily iron-sulfur-dependent hydro-lyase beta chain